MPLTIIRNDITKMNVDAIVNAANSSLQMGGGVCGAIFSVAGVDRLQAACNNHAPIQTGDAVLTSGFALPAKYIVHTAGPIYQDGKQGEELLLRSCYINALNLAKTHGCESIAFPLISSGIYGYPKDEALAVATTAIGEWLIENDMDVSLVVYDKEAFVLSRKLYGEVKAFIDKHYVDEREAERQLRRAHLRFDEHAQRKYEATESMMMPMPVAQSVAPKAALGDMIGQLDESFSATLLRLIDTRGKTDVEIYKRANIDRKLFSKIRTGKGYMPSKKTAVALAVALELSLTETRELLERAGFTLSRSVLFDVIIEYFVSRKRYDIFEINNVLFEYDQQLLGG
jgi:O-acetyl-ADP-ribose deacetylase (regulator of RNase III)